MIDHSQVVEDILRDDDTLSNDQRADLFDVWFHAPNHWRLSQYLQMQSVNATTRARLLRTKLDSMPLAIKAIQQMQEIEAEDLDRAEKHSTVLKALIAANGRRS